MRFLPLVFLSLILLKCTETSAQSDTVWISGTTIDSLTRVPIPFVAVRNHSSNLGTFTDDEGKFTIRCSQGDTLTMSMVGYLPKNRVIFDDQDILILLNENAQLLKPVTVYGNFKPQGQSQWGKSIVLPKTFRNPAGPGSGYAVETFGPGVVLSGVLSRFTKSEKEKRKLKKDREESKATETYLNTITSPEVKDFFMKTFSLTETEYSKRIERFNLAYPQVAYLTNKDEIMKMLVNFFAEKTD
jgi:hypothetical protein